MWDYDKAKHIWLQLFLLKQDETYPLEYEIKS